MAELLQAAISGVNILPTAFLVFTLLYWLAVILGLLDLDFLNIETETAGSVEADGVSAISWLNGALAFFNLGKVPLMVFLTFLALPFWVLAILANHYLNNNYELLGLLYLAPAFGVALLVARVLTAPLVKLFAALEQEHASTASMIGQVCTLTLPASPAALGQAAVKTAGAPLLLHVKTIPGCSLKKGETALVVAYDPENKFYLIEPYEIL